jgi:hypothetical protein
MKKLHDFSTRLKTKMPSLKSLSLSSSGYERLGALTLYLSIVFVTEKVSFIIAAYIFLSFLVICLLGL